MLVVRDRYGVKPLYFLEDEHGIYFSSEIKAFGSMVNGIDFAALDKYLSYLWCPGARTPSVNVRRFCLARLLLLNQALYMIVLPGFIALVILGPFL